MRTLELSDSIDRMAYQQLWAATFPGVPEPSFSQGGRRGYEITVPTAQADEFSAALRRTPGYARLLLGGA
jgi:hypothetical protein